MKIHVFKNKELASAYVSEMIKDSLQKNHVTFGLATGSTPEPLYAILRQSNWDFSQATAINLDEYYGLASDHPQSYAHFMQKQLFQDKTFKETFIPNGANSNVEEEISKYEEILKKHPVDLQILGIGTNGHIGFNEPGTPFNSLTHLVDLTPSTIESNQRFFENISQVPTQAYSMGIQSIFNAKKIVLMAFGSAKSDIIAQAFQGPVTENIPASILQNHPDTVIILDEAAAEKLQLDSHYHG